MPARQAFALDGLVVDICTAELAQRLGLDAARLAQAQENALKEYERLERVKDDAIRAAEIEAEKNAAAAATAARAADRLRGDVANLRASIAAAPRAAVNQYAATTSELLAECGRELADVARAADGHAADVRLMLGAWPR